MTRENYISTVRKHYQSIWGTPCDGDVWERGPFYEMPEGFHVIEFGPDAIHDFWRYGTVGMSTADSSQPVELHLFSQIRTRRCIELLSVVAHYHCTEKELGLHHIVNFGEPWDSGSLCQRGYISLPYFDGPKLERLNDGELSVAFFWLLPITEAEREYAIENGVEDFERRLEESDFDYLNPLRPSGI